MRLLRTVAEGAQVAGGLPRPLGLVPTMGALHAGHVALATRARAECASVVASIFVNPLQFGPTEDFARYPRAFDDDVRALEAAGVDAVFAPSVEEMYPPGFDTAVDPGAIATRYEGALRPGHFRGVATVCMRLFGIHRPDRAYFGVKDAQQLAMLQQIVRDLHVPVELVAVPTVREDDGLALSSRNAYLTGAQRTAAPGLAAALRAMVAAVERGERDRVRIAAAGRKVLPEPLREAYFDVVDPLTFAPVDIVPETAGEGGSPVLLAIGSAWLGTTRLLDNLAFAVPARALAANAGAP